MEIILVMSKNRRCSLTGYSEKISEHPCKGDWRRWQKKRIPYKYYLITLSFINTDNELLEKEPRHARYV